MPGDLFGLILTYVGSLPLIWTHFMIFEQGLWLRTDIKTTLVTMRLDYVFQNIDTSLGSCGQIQFVEHAMGSMSKNDSLFLLLLVGCLVVVAS